MLRCHGWLQHPQDTHPDTCTGTILPAPARGTQHRLCPRAHGVPALAGLGGMHGALCDSAACRKPFLLFYVFFFFFLKRRDDFFQEGRLLIPAWLRGAAYAVCCAVADQSWGTPRARAVFGLCLARCCLELCSHLKYSIPNSCWLWLELSRGG